MIPPTSSFRIVTPHDDPARWDAYVRKHPLGNVFHLSGMHRAFDEASKYVSLARAAVDDDGHIQAMIAPVRVDSGAALTRNFTSRAIMFGEPLCHPNKTSIAAVETLLEHHDAEVSRTVLLTEVRSLQKQVDDCPILSGCGYKPKSFCNYVVDLSLSEDELWSKIGKQMRGNITRSIRRGVTIETGNSDDLIRRARRQIYQSHRRSMIPTPKADLFQGVRNHLEDALRVRVATHDGVDVAGTIGLAWGDRFLAWFGGTSRPSSLNPFACIVWDEIKCARKQGLDVYDFGGAGDPSQPYGPREFKSRFHGELVQHGRCCKVYSPRLLAMAESGYRSLKRVTRAK